MEKPIHLTAEANTQLQEAITLLLSRWTALRMAIENEWGGRDSRQKSKQLAADIFSWFKQSKETLDIYDLEIMLDEFMLSLNTEIEDGSIEEIAEKLMTMHEECLEGNFITIERLKEAGPPVAVPHFKQAFNVDDSDSDSSTGEEDDSLEMVVDATESKSKLNQNDMMVDDEPIMPTETADPDGWTVVSSRRNRGRRQ